MKSYITTKVNLDVDKNEIYRFVSKKYTVDNNGQTLDETEFDDEGDVVYKRIYRYFETGELQEYIEYNPDNDLLERHIYTKNNSGEIDTIEKEFIGGFKLTKVFSYTDLGNADKAEIRNEDDEIAGFEIYTYNEDDTVKSEIELDGDSNEISKIDRLYSENGLLVSEKKYVHGDLFFEEFFEYDGNDNIIKKLHKNLQDSLEIVDIYEYDDYGNMVYNSTHQNGHLIFENKCVYDTNNALICEEFFELDYWTKGINRHERLIHEVEE
jgi:hypothetical protein